MLLCHTTRSLGALASTSARPDACAPCALLRGAQPRVTAPRSVGRPARGPRSSAGVSTRMVSVWSANLFACRFLTRHVLMAGLQLQYGGWQEVRHVLCACVR